MGARSTNSTRTWPHAVRTFGEKLLQPREEHSHGMDAVKAKAVNGRFVIDEPSDLPEGSALYLVPVSKQDEERIDVEETNEVLEAMKACGETPIPPRP